MADLNDQERELRRLRLKSLRAAFEFDQWRRDTLAAAPPGYLDSPEAQNLEQLLDGFSSLLRSGLNPGRIGAALEQMEAILPAIKADVERLGPLAGDPPADFPEGPDSFDQEPPEELLR